MNAVRIAALLRELADAFDDAFPEPEKPAPRASRKPRTMVRPAGESSPEAAERAARVLRDKGFR